MKVIGVGSATSNENEQLARNQILFTTLNPDNARVLQAYSSAWEKPHQ
jgi:hypothetical protein